VIIEKKDFRWLIPLLLLLVLPFVAIILAFELSYINSGIVIEKGYEPARVEERSFSYIINPLKRMFVETIFDKEKVEDALYWVRIQNDKKTSKIYLSLEEWEKIEVGDLVDFEHPDHYGLR
jgi:hypothetical protein